MPTIRTSTLGGWLQINLNVRANSVFWSRALNIPFPRDSVFPKIQTTDSCSSANGSIQTSIKGEYDDKTDLPFSYSLNYILICIKLIWLILL